MNLKITTLVVVAGVTLASAAGFADEPAANSAGPKRSITLNMKKGEVSDALRLVAEQGGLNLVIGPEVKGEVSVYLTDATLETALKAIATNNGFTYSVDDNVITVAKASDKPVGGEAPTPALITSIFTLRSVGAERVKDALEFALSKWGKMKVLNQNSQDGYGVQRLSALGGEANATNGSTGASGGTSGNNGFGASNGAQSQGISTQQVQGQDQARNARVLVVTDTPESVERISRLVADLDRLPPQVLIEARIVEMSTNLQRQLGIDWNMSVLANGPILNHEWPIRNRAGFASGSQIRRSSGGSPFQSAGLALGTIDFSQLTALFQANQSDAAIRLLANPRLLVYNNHSASILVGERYPILQANISNFGTATESLQQYIPVGVQLEVTPTIMMDGAISMLVHPATSALGDDVIGTTGLHVARIRTRELDTRVIMRDGQTIVLGGLISDRKIHEASKVPGLGDIPVLSAIFRQERPRSDRVDLLVFLTAHVESATQISERDQKVFDMYKPHFKQVERLQDVPLHFEIPTEYAPPKPMFSDPPVEDDEESASDEDPLDNEPASQPNAPLHKEAATSLKAAQVPATVENNSPTSAAHAPPEAALQSPTAPQQIIEQEHDAVDRTPELEEENSDTVPKQPEQLQESPKPRTHVRAALESWLNSEWDGELATWWALWQPGADNEDCPD